MTASDGQRPPGKMKVWIQLAPRSWRSYPASGKVITCRLSRPPGANARSHTPKKLAKYSAPTASSISIDTTASYVPVTSR
jgi:hypothetical protein